MKRNTLILTVGLVAVGPAFADNPQIVYGDWATRHNLKWYASSGEQLAAFPEGAVAWVTNTYNGDSSPSIANGATMTATKLVVDIVPWKPNAWFDNMADVHRIGSGGVVFNRQGVLSYGYRNSSEEKSRLRLTADQTWQGPSALGSSGDGYSHFVVGSIGYYNGAYAQMPLGHDAAVTAWNIGDYLTVWMNSPYNDLSTMDVTVTAPARLYLPETYYLTTASGQPPTLQSPARLKAKSLTLDGDGDRSLALGEDIPYISPNQMPTDYKTIRLVTQLNDTTVGQSLILKNGADLTSTNAVTTLSLTNWRVTGTGESILKGRFAFGKAANTVTVDEGATLFLDGEFSGLVEGAALTVDGTGCFCISSSSAWGLAGAPTLGENVKLLLRRKGRWDEAISGTREIIIDAGAGNGLYLPASALTGWSGTAITVRSGTLVLDDPLSGVTVTPSDAVRYAGGLLVTDKERTEAIALSGDQTLEVYGSGLTASSVLTLTGGSAAPCDAGGVTNIVFRAPATIAAAVNLPSSNPAYVYPSIRADNCVTGTISGKLTVGDRNYLYLTGPGAVLLTSGGVSIGEYTRVCVSDEGSLIFEDGDYKLGWKTMLATVTTGRYIGIRNGATLTVNGTDQRLNMEQPKDGTYRNGSTLEVGTGGKLVVSGRGLVRIGGAENAASLILSGGTIDVLTPHESMSENFLMGSGYSTVTFVMTGGTLNLAHPVNLNYASDRILFRWYGGTIKPLPEFAGDGLFGGGLGGGNDPDTRNISVGILGADAAIDLSDLAEGTTVTNIAPTGNRGEWYGDGTLTVKGGRTLVMHSMPNQAKLRIEGDGTRVITDADTRYFDNAKCTQYAVWRRPYVSGGPDYYNSKTLGLETNGFDVVSLTYANGAGALVNGAADVPVAVRAVTVAAGGVWDNETSLVSPLRTVTDLTIGDSGVWHVTGRGAQTVRLTVGGTLTLGDAPCFTKRGLIPEGAILSSPNPIVGSPEWVTRRASYPYLTDDGCGLGVRVSGLVLFLK